MLYDSEESEDDENSVSSILSEVSLIRGIMENNPYRTHIEWDGNSNYIQRYIQNMSDEDWEQLGRDISNNIHLHEISLYLGVLNDRTMSSLFRGLTGSRSIEELHLFRNELSVAGVGSMVPFLQSANNLFNLNLDGNNIQSEGFNELFRAFRDSPIEQLRCCGCGIGSIEIDIENIPRQLKLLDLNGNFINADGCRVLSKLLQWGDATLERLDLRGNYIDDESVEILVNALQSNTSLTILNLSKNDGISSHGIIMLLKLVNNISSIKATLQSNHTLKNIYLKGDNVIEYHIARALESNRAYEGDPERAGKDKIINFQIDSSRRAALAELQGVRQSLYSEINPLHLPEVFASVGRYLDEGELYIALKSSIEEVMSTVNRKQCLQQQMAYHKAKIAEHRASLEAAKVELAAIETEEVHDSTSIWSESPRSNKKLRAL